MRRQSRQERERVEDMTDEDLQRVHAILAKIGGQHVQWGSKDVLDVWIAESRMESDRRSSRRLTTATWALVVVTLGLVVATIGLIAVAQNGG